MIATVGWHRWQHICLHAISSMKILPYMPPVPSTRLEGTLFFTLLLLVR